MMQRIAASMNRRTITRILTVVTMWRGQAREHILDMRREVRGTVIATMTKRKGGVEM